jgi:prolyl-tRNA editing enzyme YbaK/EbsC (Cys-tRNA(Pro) deacylase)
MSPAGLARVMTALANRSVQRVIEALVAAGAQGLVVELAATARTAEDAALALDVPVGAIVKSLVFTITDQPVIALVAGDRRCAADTLATTLGLVGKTERATADCVRSTTGFAIGGVPPLAHATRLPTAIDAGLARFPRLYAAAGHPHCVFPTTLDELVRLTGGIVSHTLGEG